MVAKEGVIASLRFRLKKEKKELLKRQPISVFLLAFSE
jgi:hypothetical protein